MVKKTKKIKRKFGEDSTFGRMYEFRGVRYWLYRRKDNFGACTGNYHTKIRVEGEPEVRRSCRNSDFEQSRNKVHEMIIEFFVTGQTLRSRPFKFVSKHFLEEMEKDSEILESEKKKCRYVVNDYFNGFFGEMKIDSIDDKTIQKYRTWRKNYWKEKLKDDPTYSYERNGQTIVSNKSRLLKKPVSPSTLHKEDVILRKVFEFGKLTGDVSKYNKLKIKSETVKVVRKPSFTKDEWDRINERSRYRSSDERLWENRKDTTTRKKYKKQNNEFVNETVLNQRKLLHDFINFMVGSGCRTTEGMNLKWVDIEDNEIIEEKNGKFKKVQSVKLYVSGKGKKRKCDPQPYVKDVLERIKERQIQFSKKNKFKFKGKDKYVFSDEFGNKIDSFRKSFSNLLEDCGLLTDKFGAKRVIGSMRHTYGTFRKNFGEVDSYDLSVNMGTSVEMIEKFYVHSDDYDRSSSITRIKKKMK